MLKLFCLFILFFGLCAVAQAKHVYQYTDAQGVVHFTDQKPPDNTAGVKSTLVRTDAQPLLRSREDGTDEDRTIVFVNSTGGPVTVELNLIDATNVRSEPEQMPARVVLPGLSETRALHIVAPNPAAGYRYRYKYTYLPGDYRAQPDDSVSYRLPVPRRRARCASVRHSMAPTAIMTRRAVMPSISRCPRARPWSQRATASS